MPRKTKVQDRSVKQKERHFVNLYVTEGVVEEKIPDCARRAHLPVSACRKLLQRKSVQTDIRLRMEPVRMEQFRQQVISEAATKAKEQHQKELSASVNAIQKMKIDLEVLDHELMTMAVGLDKNLFPKEKLDSIKAAYVVFGTLESGNTRRLIPPEHLAKNEGQGTYTSLFNRLSLSSPSPDPTIQEGVFDLTPRSAEAFAPVALPAAGESIDEPIAPVKSLSNVITVEVG